MALPGGIEEEEFCLPMTYATTRSEARDPMRMAGRILRCGPSNEILGTVAGTVTTEGVEFFFTSSTGTIKRYPPLGIVWINRGFFLSSSKTLRSSEIDRVRTSSVT